MKMTFEQLHRSRLNKLLKRKEQLEDELSRMRENLSNKECELEQLNLQIGAEREKDPFKF